ncbi:MAG: response regulator [Thermodesulfobacteria bacterium]|nr:response regulator [Thermodesulfobacteriota bacterium]
MADSLNILIVDDEKILRENLELLLSSFSSCRTLQAENAYRALELMQKYPVDLVLLDVNMPGLSGIDLLKLMRREGIKTPVILMTSYPSLDLTVEALRHGATDFLIKPFTSQQLYEAIERFKKREALEAREDYQELLRLLKQKTREQTLLFTVSDRLTSCNSVTQLYNEIIRLSVEFTESEEGVLYLLDLEKGTLFPEVWEGFSEKPPVLRCDGSNPISKSVRESLPYIIPARGKEKALLVNPFQIKGENLGALALCRQKSFNKDDLFCINLILERAAPLAENFILYESIVLNLHDALRALVKALEAKDPYTKEHSERVTNYALLIAREMGLSTEELEMLRFAGHLHDVGKVGIADAILLKPSRLTSEEYEIIKQHPVIGAEIVGHIGLLQEEARIIRYHHERFDGQGYPEGLRGEEIPLLARILAVADTYDAMTTRRPYRPSLSAETAYQEILRCSGSQFDPEIVEIFKVVWQEQLQKEEKADGFRESVA